MSDTKSFYFGVNMGEVPGYENNPALTLDDIVAGVRAQVDMEGASSYLTVDETVAAKGDHVTKAAIVKVTVEIAEVIG